MSFCKWHLTAVSAGKYWEVSFYRSLWVPGMRGSLPAASSAFTALIQRAHTVHSVFGITIKKDECQPSICVSSCSCLFYLLSVYMLLCTHLHVWGGQRTVEARGITLSGFLREPGAGFKSSGPWWFPSPPLIVLEFLACVWPHPALYIDSGTQILMPA